MKKALIALYGLMVLLYASAYGFSLAALLVPVPFVGLALLTTEGVSRVIGKKAGGSVTNGEMLVDKRRKGGYDLFADPLTGTWPDDGDPFDPGSGLYHLHHNN